MDTKPIAVIGIGTLLFSDQSLGLRVARTLSQENLPYNVEIIEAGMSGLNLIPWMDEREKVIFICSIPAGTDPGTLHCMQSSELESLLPEMEDVDDDIPMETTDADDEFGGEEIHLADRRDLIDAIHMADYIGIKPKVVIIGLEPKSTIRGTELSEILQRKVPDVLNQVKKEISNL